MSAETASLTRRVLVLLDGPLDDEIARRIREGTEPYVLVVPDQARVSRQGLHLLIRQLQSGPHDGLRCRLTGTSRRERNLPILVHRRALRRRLGKTLPERVSDLLRGLTLGISPTSIGVMGGAQPLTIDASDCDCAQDPSDPTHRTCGCGGGCDCDCASCAGDPTTTTAGACTCSCHVRHTPADPPALPDPPPQDAPLRRLADRMTGQTVTLTLRQRGDGERTGRIAGVINDLLVFHPTNGRTCYIPLREVSVLCTRTT